AAVVTFRILDPVLAGPDRLVIKGTSLRLQEGAYGGDVQFVRSAGTPIGLAALPSTVRAMRSGTCTRVAKTTGRKTSLSPVGHANGWGCCRRGDSRQSCVRRSLGSCWGVRLDNRGSGRRS